MSGVAENVKNSFKDHWKAILWGLIPIVILVIIFALPLKIVAIQTTETYIDTEMQQQPYTVQETYEETEPYQSTETQTRTIYDSNVNTSGWSYSFTVDEPGTKVSIKLTGNSYYYPYYYQPYYFYDTEDDGVFPTWPNYYGYSWWCDSCYSGNDKVTIQLSYPENVTKYRTVTKTRDVVKYIEVPVQVEKERVVTRWVQMSIWQYLFLDQSQKADLPEI
jgi:hypothetical protein